MRWDLRSSGALLCIISQKSEDFGRASLITFLFLKAKKL
jgi:hypothetical protein